MEAEEAQWCQNHQRPITHKCDACDFTGCIVCAAVHEIRLGPPHQAEPFSPSKPNKSFKSFLTNIGNIIKKNIKDVINGYAK